MPVRHIQHHFPPFQLSDLFFQTLNGLPIAFQDALGVSIAAGGLNGIQREIRTAQFSDV